MKRTVISYIPLLDIPPDVLASGADLAPHIERARALAHTDVGEVAGCTWLQDDSGLVAVFILRQARAIYEHMLRWSENELGKWFQLHIHGFDDFYFIAMSPNLNRSRDRSLANEALMRGQSYSADDPQFIFKPLLFISQNIGQYSVVREQIGKSIRVQFTEHIGTQDVNVLIQGAFDVGQFALTESGFLDTFVQSIRSR